MDEMEECGTVLGRDQLGNASILLLFLPEELLVRPCGRLCLAAPSHERQPASSVSSAVRSLGRGLCCSPRVFWWPLGMQNDAMWWIFNELFKNLRTCIEKIALKAHYGGCKVKHTKVRKWWSQVGLWTINSGTLHILKWSLAPWSHPFLLGRTSAMFHAQNGWCPTDVNLNK